jgi:hypothetical protein
MEMQLLNRIGSGLGLTRFLVEIDGTQVYISL